MSILILCDFGVLHSAVSRVYSGVYIYKQKKTPTHHCVSRIWMPASIEGRRPRSLSAGGSGITAAGAKGDVQYSDGRGRLLANANLNYDEGLKKLKSYALSASTVNLKGPVDDAVRLRYTSMYGKNLLIFESLNGESWSIMFGMSQC